MSDAEVPATAFSELYLPPVAFGLGTIFQDDPLYCSIRVDEVLLRLYACPTAQTLDGENEVTAPSTSFPELFGLAMICHEAADAGAAPITTGTITAAARATTPRQALVNVYMTRSSV